MYIKQDKLVGSYGFTLFSSITSLVILDTVLAFFGEMIHFQGR